MYYPCSENKGADQICSYCKADLRLCFHLCRLFVFPWGRSNVLPCAIKMGPLKPKVKDCGQ